MDPNDDFESVNDQEDEGLSDEAASDVADEPIPEEDDSDKEILERAHRNFKIAQEAWSEVYKEAMEDYKFRSGDQWPDEIRTARDQDNRPCLTVNRLPTFINQVVNDIRQNRPSIAVNATGNGAQVETAEVFEGIIRHIEYVSSADAAYDAGFEGQVTGGFGYWRVVTEYENQNSFNLEPRIKRVRNPFSVLPDPSFQEPDGSDQNWCHIFDDISKDEFRSTYPKAKLSQMADWTMDGNQPEGWVAKDGCRIDEYFEIVRKPTKLYLLTNGDTVLEEDVQDVETQTQEGADLFATDEKGERVCRPTFKICVMWYKLNGIEILERREFPCRWIPVVPVLGTEMIIEGERILEGIVRHARDPQRMLNFWTSAETELIALAPKAPWIGAAGQFEGFEDKWQTANTRNHAYLEYNESSSAGKPIGPPVRNTYEPPVQAITQARMASADDMKATTGIFDPTLGARSNETSGVAIQRRNTQAQTSNFHFSDNGKRSIRHTGRILVDMIPKVYDTDRAVRIIDDEDQQSIVQVNKIFQDGGVDKIHRLDVGTYDVVCDEGPSFQTKRQEAVSAMLELTRAYPQIMQICGDLLVTNMDWPGAKTIADRLRKMLPPNIADDDKNKQPIPQAAQQQMQQMQAMIQQMSQKMNEQSDIIRTKRLELESKERIEYEKLQADFRIEFMRSDAAMAKTVFVEEMAHLKHLRDSMPETAAAPEQNSNPSPNAGPSMGAAPGAGMNQTQNPTGGMPG